MQKVILCSLPILAPMAAASSALEGAGESWRREPSSLTNPSVLPMPGQNAWGRSAVGPS